MTLAAAVAVENFVFRNPSINRMSGSPIAPPELIGIDLGIRRGQDTARAAFAYLTLAVLVLCALAVGNVARSATGRRFLAVRSNERAAAAVGIDVSPNKLAAFGFSAFLAGVGGTLIGYSRGSLSAESFTALVGVSWLMFAYLGGISSVSGAFVAGVLAPLGLSYVIFDRWLGATPRLPVVRGGQPDPHGDLQPRGHRRSDASELGRRCERSATARRRAVDGRRGGRMDVAVGRDGCGQRGHGRPGPASRCCRSTS